MISFKRFVYLLVLSFVMLQSCKKDRTKIHMHETYFGLIYGRYIDYQVTEIIHDIDFSKPHDTLYYQLRTLIGDTLIDNEGRIARRYIRFKRNSPSDKWVETDIWTAIVVDRRAELVEENERLIKLVFPPVIKKSWNVNAFNNFPKVNAKYTRVHVPVKIGNYLFDSTLTVQHDTYRTMIDYYRHEEIYAKNIGLVHKYYKNLKIDTFDTSLVLSGRELFYTIRGFGFQ